MTTDEAVCASRMTPRFTWPDHVCGEMKQDTRAEWQDGLYHGDPAKNHKLNWGGNREASESLEARLYLTLLFRSSQMWDTAEGRNLRQVRVPAETGNAHALTQQTEHRNTHTHCDRNLI